MVFDIFFLVNIVYVLVNLSMELFDDQYQNILKVIKGCLNDHHIFASDARIKHAFPIFERLIHDIYSKPLPLRLQRRSKYEYRIIRSIRCLLRRRPDIIIRRTDKSKVLYVGKLEDFDRKAMEYMMKTEAYEEITNGRSPLADNYRTVQTLLDYLVSKNALTRKQANKLLPNVSKLELGHYHGLPKPHKVSLSFLIVFDIIFFCNIAWNTITTNHCIDQCTIDTNIEILKQSSYTNRSHSGS